MAAKTIKMALTDILEDLSKDEFKKFCHNLLDRRAEPRVRRKRVEGKSYLDIADVLVSTFTEDGAVTVAVEILNQMLCQQEAKELDERVIYSDAQWLLLTIISGGAIVDMMAQGGRRPIALYGRAAAADAEPASLHDQTDYYALTHNPRGLCVVINNEIFGIELKNRGGTQQDEKVLHSVFLLLGFEVVVYNNLTAESIRCELKKLSKRNFSNEDALVVCVLSHGEIGCVFGTDEKKVTLTEMTQLFTSNLVPTLAGKPKLFFIQACQGTGHQQGVTPCPPRPSHERGDRQSQLEEDAGPVRGKTIPWGADFLLGMATVQECKSFRNTSTGSIYIQELCRQLMRSAESPEKDDILTVLTRVNREVSNGEYLGYKQMPEPKYTLTKKVVLRYV